MVVTVMFFSEYMMYLLSLTHFSTTKLDWKHFSENMSGDSPAHHLIGMSRFMTGFFPHFTSNSSRVVQGWDGVGMIPFLA
jgi:hypothetical protein